MVVVVDVVVEDVSCDVDVVVEDVTCDVDVSSTVLVVLLSESSSDIIDSGPESGSAPSFGALSGSGSLKSTRDSRCPGSVVKPSSDMIISSHSFPFSSVPMIFIVSILTIPSIAISAK